MMTFCRFIATNLLIELLVARRLVTKPNFLETAFNEGYGRFAPSVLVSLLEVEIWLFHDADLLKGMWMRALTIILVQHFPLVFERV